MTVNVAIQQKKGLERQLKVEFSHEIFDSQYKNKIHDLKKNMKLHGFRPGKVPFTVIEKNYGNNVWQEIVEKQINDLLDKSLKDKQIKPIGDINIQDVQMLFKQDVKITLSLEVMPDMTNLVSLEEKEIELIEIDVNDNLDTQEKFINAHILPLAQWQESQEVANYFDKLAFTILKAIDEEGNDLLKNNKQSAKHEEIIWNKEYMALFANSIPNEIIEAIIGSKTKDTINAVIKHSFDLDNEQFPLSNKTITYEIIINKISKATNFDINKKEQLQDEFFVNVKTNVKDFTEKMTTKFQDLCKSSCKNVNMKLLFKSWLLLNKDIELPQKMLQKILDEEKKHFNNFNNIDKQAIALKELVARRNLLLQILFMHYSIEKKCILTNDDIDKALYQIILNKYDINKMNTEMLNYFKKHYLKEKENEVSWIAMENKISEQLLTEVKIKYNKKSFIDLMQLTKTLFMADITEINTINTNN